MIIHRWLEKYFALLTLGFLALISYFQARGIGLLVAAAIDAPTLRPAARATGSAPLRRHATADAILVRNPFDPLTGSLDVRAAPLAAAPANADPLSAPECDSPRVVIVTQAWDPTWSVAALQSAADPRPRNHRVGDQVAGKTIEFIGYNPKQAAPSVWLSSRGGLCQTLLFGPAPKPPSANSVTPTTTGARAGETALLSHVRVVPERSGGSIVGIRLFGIGSDSLLASVGLQNGDRLESINGLSLGTPEQALAAYAHLRAATRLAVAVNRRGKAVTLAYRID
ncbi:MAG TPA: hypothetical protein VNW92_07170 [Polyangiaceae bacterium]|jgi:general secretion pathway protein C|nr:hypothetical protein [Polyangiaceae bacterium]